MGHVNQAQTLRFSCAIVDVVGAEHPRRDKLRAVIMSNARADAPAARAAVKNQGNKQPSFGGIPGTQYHSTPRKVLFVHTAHHLRRFNQGRTTHIGHDCHDCSVI